MVGDVRGVPSRGRTPSPPFGRLSRKGRYLVFTFVDAETIRAISYRRSHDKALKRYGL